MIPRTFPSTYASNGQQQMVVYFLPSIAGLQRWLDYIPVKLSQGGVENSYANNGYIDVTVVSRPTAAQQAWKEYIPVYLDDAATDAWRVNATGYIPYGYALFGGASMIMDMTNTGALDSRVTFSRTSNATQFDSSGNLVYAPHNLLTFSEQFDNTVGWSVTASSVSANAAVAPDGTTTADRLIENTATADHLITRAAIPVTRDVQRTHSVYVKANGRTSVRLQDNAFSGNFARADYNLSNGTVSNIVANGAAVIGGTSITNVGNGWFRCTLTVTPNPTAGGGSDLTIRTLIGDVAGYTGDGVSGLFLWGAQLNIGTLQPYYPTTVKNLLGFAQEFDNAAWTKTNSFVQTNQIRNNTMQGAVAGTPGTVPTNWASAATTNGLNRQIVGSGISDGIAYIDVRYSGTTTAGAFVNFAGPEANNFIAASNGQSWTSSAWVAVVAGSTANLTNLSMRTRFSDSGGVELTQAAVNLLTATSTMQRFNIASTASNASTAFVATNFSFQFNSGVAVDITLRIGWPQLVQGAVAGDPVPTYGTARAVMYPAPDGSVTGDKLVETTAAGQHFINVAGITTISGTPYTASVYMKAAERTFAAIEAVLTTGGVEGVFNLSAGTVTLSAYGGAASPTGSITSVGNGWYRCVVTFTANGASTALRATKLYQNSTTQSYTGDGTSGIYIWGAQLSDSASLDPYVYNPVAAPTAAAYYGPRFDYDPATLAARGLLIEEQRTNSIRNNTMVGAVAGTPGTAPTNWVVSTGAGITRQLVEVGVENGIAYIDYRFSGTGSVVNDTQFDVGNFIAAASGQAWTHAVYCRLVAGSLTNVTVTQILAENSAAGAFLAASTQNITPTSAALGTQRYALTRTLNNASTAFTVPTLRVTSAGAIDVTVRIGLPQLELGAFATSVIPTTTAAATRTADVATMVGANFSNWYRQDGGTIFGEYSISFDSSASIFPVIAAISDNSFSNTIAVYERTVDDTRRAAIRTGGVEQADITSGGTYVYGTVSRQAAAYKVNDFAISVNGALVGTDTSGTVPVVDRMALGGNSVTGGALGYINGHILRISYWPRRLANAELQGVTA